MLNKKINSIISLYITLLIIFSLSSIAKAEDNYLKIINNTGQDIYVGELVMNPVDSAWYCPMAILPKDKNPSHFQPIPKNSTREITWKCSYAYEIKFKLKDGQYSRPFKISEYQKTTELNLENNEIKMDVSVTRTDNKETSADFPFYQTTFTIDEINVERFKFSTKPKKEEEGPKLKKPTLFRTEGVKKVTIENKLSYAGFTLNLFDKGTNNLVGAQIPSKGSASITGQKLGIPGTKVQLKVTGQVKKETHWRDDFKNNDDDVISNYNEDNMSTAKFAINTGYKFFSILVTFKYDSATGILKATIDGSVGD